MTNDSKLIEMSCKEHLMNVVKESSELDSKLSFFQKTLLYDKIKEMKYDNVIGLLFNEGEEITTEQKREFESDVKKAAKYGTAAVGGSWAAKRAKHYIAKHKIDKLANDELAKFDTITGSVERAKKIKNLEKELLTRRGGKLKKLLPKYQKGGTQAGLKGAFAAVAGLYLYRKLSDPCVRKNLGNKDAQVACKMAAIKKVISQIKNDMGSCSGAADPGKCRQKLSKELIKWQTKYQQYLIQSTQEKRKKTK